jgi:uncharacterized protein
MNWECAVLKSVITLVLTTTLVACSSPRERLYLLDATTETGASGGASGVPAPRDYAGTVILGPVSIPPEVDRPQIMVLEGDQLAMSEQDRWALPLKQAIPRALAAALAQRTPYRFATMESAAVESPSAHLAVDVTHFEVSPSAGALLTAHWVWRPTAGGSSTSEGEAAAHADVRAAGSAGAADALRRATTTLAQRIAAELPTPQSPGEERR